MKSTKENKDEPYKIDKDKSMEFSQINFLDGEAKIGASPQKVLNQDVKETSMIQLGETQIAKKKEQKIVRFNTPRDDEIDTSR